MDGEGRERVWEVEHSEVMVYEEAMPLTLPGLRRLLSSVERPEDLQKFEETNLDAADWCFTQQAKGYTKRIDVVQFLAIARNSMRTVHSIYITLCIDV